MAEIGRYTSPFAATGATGTGHSLATRPPGREGWRFWSLDLFTGQLRAPLWGDLKVTWRPGWNTASCAPPRKRRPHSALTADCPCGIYVCPDLPGLLGLVSKRAGGPIVFGRVQYAGRVLPSPYPVEIEPPGTLRVERARLLELDVRSLRPELRDDAARFLGQRYHVPVRQS